MKKKDQVNPNGKPAFYALLYNSMRQAALDCGYALAIHGSMQRDMDLLAVAWVEDAKSPEDLMQAIDDCIGNSIWKYHNTCTREEKPHGRISYGLHVSHDWYIDLSIIPPTT